MEKNKASSSENFHAIVNGYEEREMMVKKSNIALTSNDNRHKESYLGCFSRFKRFLATTRYAALPLICIYGILLYLYLYYMVFSTSTGLKEHNKRKNVSSSCFIDDLEKEIPILKEKIKAKLNLNSSQSEASQPVTFDKEIISAVVAGTFTLSVGTLSVFSRHTRCILMLILPGIVAGRGRAFLLTIAVGFLIEGPISSVNYNVNEVVESTACMYESMKSLACSFNGQSSNAIEQMWDVIEKQHEYMEEQLKSIKNEITRATGKVKRDLQRKQRELEAAILDVKTELDKTKRVLDKLGKPCNFAGSVFNKVKNGFGKTGKKIGGFFKGRKRRDANVCGVPIPLPEVNIDPTLTSKDLKNLNDWAGDLIPSIDIKPMNDLDLNRLLEAPNIEDIRFKILGSIKEVFKTILSYLSYIKKFFIIISLLLLTIDSVRYLKQYFTDNAFDNMFADDNLRGLWWEDGNVFEKLTPLRRWELEMKYQVTASVKMSKSEIQTMILKSLAVIIVIAISVFIILGDYALKELLSNLASNAGFAIGFKGMEQGIVADIKLAGQTKKAVLSKLNLRKFDLSTEPCLPRPMKTENQTIIILSIILVIVLLSCIFDAYALRLRARICNSFYPDRAHERAVYLHKRIVTGRHSRKIQLRGVILRESRKRKLTEQFSWLYNIRKLCRRGEKEQSECYACLQGFKKFGSEEVELRDNDGTKVKCKICKDCHKDFQ